MQSCIFVFLVFVNVVYCALYGIITDFNGNNTQTVVLTVQVNPTSGAFTQVAENFIYVGSSATYDGIAAYDQKKNYLYYSTDFEASFVYGVDVVKGEILPPVSINSESVNSIEWDGKNQQLLILGVFADHSSAIFTFPYTGASVQLINFTAKGINTPQTTFLDWANGIYYFISYTPSTSQFSFGSFPISNPQTVTTAPLNCGKSFSPDYLFLDSKKTLFGIGYNSTAMVYKYYSIKGSSCTVTDVGLNKGVVTAATYDPTSNVLYMGYVDTGNSVISLDTTSLKVVAKIPTKRILQDLQVTYKV